MDMLPMSDSGAPSARRPIAGGEGGEDIQPSDVETVRGLQPSPDPEDARQRGGVLGGDGEGGPVRGPLHDAQPLLRVQPTAGHPQSEGAGRQAEPQTRRRYVPQP
eukprot:9476768-Pyramimonas_sp.AAC.2